MKNLLFALLVLLFVSSVAGRCYYEGQDYGEQDDVFQWTCLQTQRYYMQQSNPNDLQDPPISSLNVYQKWFYDGCMNALNTSNNKLKCWSLMFMPDPSVSTATAQATVKEDRFDATFTKRAKQACYDKAKNYSFGSGSAVASAPGQKGQNHGP